MSKAKFKVGDKAIIVKASPNMAGYRVGECVEIIDRYSWNREYRVKSLDFDRSHIDLPTISLQKTELMKKQTLENQLEKINKQKSQLEKEIFYIQEKLQFIEETGCEDFDENEFKVYKTLQLIEDNSKMTRLEKAQAIAQLINNKK